MTLVLKYGQQVPCLSPNSDWFRAKKILCFTVDGQGFTVQKDKTAIPDCQRVYPLSDLPKFIEFPWKIYDGLVAVKEG